VLLVLWAARAAADPLRAFGLIDALYAVVLFGGGGLSMAVLAGSRLVSDTLNWGRTTWFVAGIGERLSRPSCQARRRRSGSRSMAALEDASRHDKIVRM
jgi:hypothetical protein